MAEELEQDLAAENVGGEADQTIEADGAVAETAAEPVAAPVNENFKWYIIHAYSGFERKVKESLMSRVAAYHLEDRVGGSRFLPSRRPSCAMARSTPSIACFCRAMCSWRWRWITISGTW